MFDNKPTDTNWIVSESTESGAILVKHVPGYVIAEIDPIDNARQYADMIAACPDMLLALETALRHARDAMPADERKLFDEDHKGPEWMFTVREAINKAKGEDWQDFPASEKGEKS